jgi:hypothetical protein
MTNNQSKMTTISIDFKEPIEVSEIQKHYPILPKGLNWNMNENQDVVGIYFSKKNEKKLKEDIHNILWYFGEFEEEDLIVSGIVCKVCKYELPQMLMSEHLDKTNQKNKCLCDEDKCNNFCCRCENFVKEDLDAGYCKKCSIAVWKEIEEEN